MAWVEWQESLCSGCGRPRHESYDPANDRAYEAVPLQCFACATRDAESRRAAKAQSDGSFGDGSFDGLYITVAERD